MLSDVLRFAEKAKKLYGTRGEAWATNVEGLLDACQTRFGVTVHEVLPNLSYNLILSVESHVGPAILKVAVETETLEREVRALQHWHAVGHGGVRVLGFDAALGAVLLERVHPGTPLSTWQDDEAATAVFCDVFRRLHGLDGRTDAGADRATIPAPYHPSGFPTLAEHCAAVDRYLGQWPEGDGPLSDGRVRTASRNLQTLLDSTTETRLLHGDLHHDNILYDATHGWRVIDAKGVVGDIHFEALQYLLNYVDRDGPAELVRRRRIEMMADRLGLSAERIDMWYEVRVVLNACWR